MPKGRAFIFNAPEFYFLDYTFLNHVNLEIIFLIALSIYVLAFL